MRRVTTPATAPLSVERLVTTIGQAHAELAAQASQAVNASLTLRNWLIGCHIAEYEQQGTDRAQYGDKLIERLSDRLRQVGVSRAEPRELRRYRQFYLAYPRIRESLTPELAGTALTQTVAGNTRESRTPELGVAANDVLTKLSFTHIAELLQCADASQRAFHEVQCIRGALAGIDNGLFVSKYLLELPKKEEIQRFIEEQLAAGAR
jgi:uncharacterized protein DUF1016